MSCMWSHTNEKEGLSFQQITSAAAGTLKLSEHNLFVLKEVTLVDFAGMDGWIESCLVLDGAHQRGIRYSTF